LSAAPLPQPWRTLGNGRGPRRGEPVSGRVPWSRTMSRVAQHHGYHLPRQPPHRCFPSPLAQQASFPYETQPGSSSFACRRPRKRGSRDQRPRLWGPWRCLPSCPSLRLAAVIAGLTNPKRLPARVEVQWQHMLNKWNRRHLSEAAPTHPQSTQAPTALPQRHSPACQDTKWRKIHAHSWKGAKISRKRRARAPQAETGAEAGAVQLGQRWFWPAAARLGGALHRELVPRERLR